MRAFVNELALAEACAAAHPRHTPLESLLEARRQHPVLAKNLYCARGMPNIEVQRNLSLVDIARRLSPDKRKLLFQWTANNGPFIEDDRQAIDDDLFQFEEQDVTDLGLGEAARRILASRSAATFSPVQDIESRFAANPLTVVHGLVEEPIARVPVANFRKADELANALLRSMPTLRTWAELLDGCRERFDRLRISDYCDSALARHPYHPPAGRRIIELLDILQRMMNQMNNEGTLSEAGMKLRSTFFYRKNSLVLRRIGNAQTFSEGLYFS